MQSGPLWRASRLLCDLSDVTFLDASGISALVSARSGAALGQVRFDVVCPSGTLHKLLAITGADRVLTVYSTLRQALRADTPNRPRIPALDP